MARKSATSSGRRRRRARSSTKGGPTATFVLVHGAGDVGWYWHLVDAELRRHGHDVVVVDLPVEDDSAGLSDYADVVVQAIGDRRNVVVVPAPGESAEAMFANTGYAPVDRTDSSDLATFYHDVDPPLADQALARGRRQSTRPGKEPWPLAAWPDVPARYLLCRRDRFFPPPWVRRVVRDRLGFVPDEIDSGHTPALSQPRELARRLEGYWTDVVAHGQEGSPA